MDKVERGNVDRWMFGLIWRGKGLEEVLSGYEKKGERCKSMGIRIMVTRR